MPARLEMPKAQRRLIKTLDREQFRLLWQAAACEYQPWLIHRDRAVLAMLLDTGMRASELCRLHVDGDHLRGGYVVVIGKGDNECEVGPLGRESLSALKHNLWDIGYGYRKGVSVSTAATAAPPGGSR